jgi:hypothetical protein
VIDAPPLSGVVQASETDELVFDATVSPDGAAGGDAGLAETVVDGRPVPTGLIADTRNEYSVLRVKDVTEIDVELEAT